MGNVVIILVLAMAGVIAIFFLIHRPDREAAARRREDAELWQRVEVERAVRCPVSRDGVPCGGMAKPIRESQDRYRCSSCGGEFVGARHGW